MTSFPLLGSGVNAVIIVIAGAVGLIVGERFHARYRNAVMKAVALSVILVGLQMALKAEEALLVAASMGLGILIGEWIDIEKHLEDLGFFLKARFKAKDGRFVEGFVTASVLYCVGSMAILGAIEEGIHQDRSILYTKSVIDGITTVALASALGVGVIFSALPVFVYQGSIAVAAALFGNVLPLHVINEMSATGGLLIFAIGMNLLGVTHLRLANFLPAMLFAAILAWLVPPGFLS